MIHKFNYWSCFSKQKWQTWLFQRLQCDDFLLLSILWSCYLNIWIFWVLVLHKKPNIWGLYLQINTTGAWYYSWCVLTAVFNIIGRDLSCCDCSEHVLMWLVTEVDGIVRHWQHRLGIRGDTTELTEISSCSRSSVGITASGSRV